MTRTIVWNALLVCGFLATPAVSRGELVITGVLDATLTGGVPKLVELFATTDIADLSVYTLENYNNGSPTVTGSLAFSGSASTGDFLYAVHSTTGQSELDTWFGSGVVTITDPNVFQGSGQAVNINGNDAFRLALSGADADFFGVIGTDGVGEPWEYTDGWAYRNDGTGPDPGGFVLADWSFSGINVLDGVGSNAAAGANAFPIGTFDAAAVPEPASLAMMGLGALGLFGTGLRRRRRTTPSAAGDDSSPS